MKTILNNIWQKFSRRNLQQKCRTNVRFFHWTSLL